jgi:glycerophosphoryl diester phosphodiesterase
MLIRCLACVLLMAAAAGAGEPIVIAHRGASGYLPEHTLEAVAAAHAQGADYIEQDVVLSKDLVPVVLHDVEVDAVTDVARKFADRKRPDGRYYAIDFTLAELKALEVNERVDVRSGRPAIPGRFPLGKGTFRIPTLDEELDLIAGMNASTGRRAGVYLEIKSPSWHR